MQANRYIFQGTDTAYSVSFFCWNQWLVQYFCVTGKYIRDRVIYEVDGRLALCYKQKIVRTTAGSRQATVCISTLNKLKVISAVKYKGIPIVQD